MQVLLLYAGKAGVLQLQKTSLSTFVDNFLFTRSQFCLIIVYVKGESETAVVALARPPFSYFQTAITHPDFTGRKPNLKVLEFFSQSAIMKKV